jgi:hypothetical protein
MSFLIQAPGPLSLQYTRGIRVGRELASGKEGLPRPGVVINRGRLQGRGGTDDQLLPYLTGVGLLSERLLA